MSIKHFMYTVAIAVVAGLILRFLTGNPASERPPDETRPSDISDPSPPPPTVPPPTVPPPTAPPPTNPPSTDPPPPEYMPLHYLVNIARDRLHLSPWAVTDNFGNEYDNALMSSSTRFVSGACSYTVLLAENFSRFQAYFFIRRGETSNRTAWLEIILDENYENIYYWSIRNTDRPISIDICVYGVTVFTVRILGNANLGGWGIESGIGNAVFIP